VATGVGVESARTSSFGFDELADAVDRCRQDLGSMMIHSEIMAAKVRLPEVSANIVLREQRDLGAKLADVSALLRNLRLVEGTIRVIAASGR
jgi:hypothetical protein